AAVRQARHPRPVVGRRDRGRSTTRRAADSRHRYALPGSRRRTAHHLTNPRAGRNESRLMDITETTAPKSDQQNYEDYIGGPKTVTISEVKRGSAEQPVEIHLVEFPGRPFKPSKTVRRIIVKAWGPETDVYAGRQMTLYGDP